MEGADASRHRGCRPVHASPRLQNLAALLLLLCRGVVRSASFWARRRRPTVGRTCVFLTNYVNHGIVEGSWSLCTEEQFYIVTPLAIYFFAPSSARRGALQAMALGRCSAWCRCFAQPSGSTAPVTSSSRSAALFPDLLPLHHPLRRTDHRPDHREPLGDAHPAAVEAREPMAARGPSARSRSERCMFCRRRSSTLPDSRSSSVRSSGSECSAGSHVFDSRLFYWISRLSFGMYLNHEYIAPWVVGANPPAPRPVAFAPACEPARRRRASGDLSRSRARYLLPGRAPVPATAQDRARQSQRARRRETLQQSHDRPRATAILRGSAAWPS